MTRRSAALLLVGLAGLGVGWPGAGPAPAQHRAPAGRQAPIEPAVLVDSLGRPVGPVIALLGPFPLVRLRADGQDALLFASRDKLTGFFGVNAEYESSDCTGTPWLPAVVAPTTPVFIVELAAVGRLSELLVANGEPVTRTIKSKWFQGDTPPACDPIVPAQDHVVQPTRVLTLLGAFTPPFRLR